MGKRGRGVPYALTDVGLEATQSVLAGMRQRRAAEYEGMEAGQEDEVRRLRSADSIGRAKQGLPSQSSMDEDLAKLQRDFPAFMIWFAKISRIQTVWTAQLKSGTGSVQEYTPEKLRERLDGIVKRMPHSA